MSPTFCSSKSGEQLENSPSGSEYCSSLGTKTGDFDNSLPFQKKIEFDLGAPISATVPPGQCVLGEDFAPIPLTSRINISGDTVVLTFGLPNKRTSLGLSTCACIVASNGQGTARAYTPISTNAMLGQFQLMVKVYDDSMGGGVMSQHMNSLAIGDTVDFKHIPFNVKVQYPFGVQHVGMLAGGTGLTPMIQALHAILGNEKDTTKATLVWSNKREKDISVPTMDNWAKQLPDRFNMVHTLTREPEDSPWSGRRDRIDKKLIEETMPSPSESCKIFVCGPADMYDPIIGLLKEMDYSDEQIVRI